MNKSLILMESHGSRLLSGQENTSDCDAVGLRLGAGEFYFICDF